VLVQLLFLVVLAILVANTVTASVARRWSQKAPLIASGGG
jgi:hypothetical protein